MNETRITNIIKSKSLLNERQEMRNSILFNNQCLQNENICQSKTILFNPAEHSWKDIVLLNKSPVVVIYGKIVSSGFQEKLVELQEKYGYVTVLFSCFNEDDGGEMKDIIINIYYEGKIIRVSKIENESIIEMNNEICLGIDGIRR